VERKADGSYQLVEEDDEHGETYLGGGDSCKGDSGGPLFVWEQNKAILIGVVSRGKGVIF